MLLQVGICDDEKEDIRILNDYMKHYEMNYDIEFDITCFSSGNDLLQTINKTPCFQILFLDVEMPGLSGIETATRVREIDMEDVCIIFVSHYPQYMQDSFNVRAFWYLQKPLTYPDIVMILNKILQSYRQSQSKKIIVPAGEEKELVNIQNILYIKAVKYEKNRLDFVLTDHTIQSHGTLLQWKQTLSPHGFVTPCRGFLVNMDFIHYICDTKLILTNGTELPLSRRQAREISDLFTKHMIIYGGNHGI